MNKIKSRGFSLIEVLISLAILAIGILALAQLQVSAIRGIAFARHMTAATHLAEQHLEWLRSLPYDPADPASDVTNQSGVPIRDAKGKPLLLDDSASGMAALDDLLPTQNWLEHWNNPLNEMGIHAASDDMKYYVRWRVTRRNPAGLAFGTPGPGQMLIEVEVVWWEGRFSRAPADVDLSLDGGSLRSSKAHMVRLQSVRQREL